MPLIAGQGGQVTIRVWLTNEDSTKTVRVTTVLFEKGVAGERDIRTQLIGPGRKADFYIHALQNLRVEEVLEFNSQAEGRPPANKTGGDR